MPIYGITKLYFGTLSLSVSTLVVRLATILTILAATLLGGRSIEFVAFFQSIRRLLSILH